ncbi:MAG: ABC transporter permease [Acidobacteriaceae bacterium]|nr:ABC transporter permease [Acidobacteriaceae bacterium]
MRTWKIWEQLQQDARYGLRSMGANKLFTLVAVASLALGIGANTAIYSFLDAIFLRALPVSHPEQLVLVNWRAKAEPAVAQSFNGSSHDEPDGSVVSGNFPYTAYEMLRDNNHVFSTLFGFAHAGELDLVLDLEAHLVPSEYVSGRYFSGLGIRPAAGRLIQPEDDRAGATPAIAIAYSFWQGSLGGRADIVGKSVLLNGKPFTVIGVAPPGFAGVHPKSPVQLFVPVHALPVIEFDHYNDQAGRFIDSRSYWIEMMGRLKPGVTLAQAQAEAGGKFALWVNATVQKPKERATLPRLWLQPGGSGVDSLRREYSKPLVVLMTMVGLILAIACANLANLLLSRSEARRREMAVRLSLGAGRLRVIRQLLTESLLLALGGALLGLAVAVLGIRAITLLLANGRPDFTLGAQLDWEVLGFTFLVALVAGMLFGLAPAIQSSRVDISPALKEARASQARAARRRFGIPFGLSHALVISQIAISLLLVAAAGLFLRTLQNLRAVDIGFNRENVLLFRLDAVQAGYRGDALKMLYADLRTRFIAIPGVRSATQSHMPLVSESNSRTDVIIPGIPSDEDHPSLTSVVEIGPDFFQTMQIPLLSGRGIDDRDRAGAPGVAVVNEAFVKKYFPRVSPLGRNFRFGGKDGQDLEIVGVAKSVRYSSLKQEAPPVTYVPYLQAPGRRPIEWMYFELRTAGDPFALANSVRRIVHEAAPQVPVAELTTQARVIDTTIVHERTFADLCSCFGALALIMACFGLYGTMAYAVSRRTGEIGIRMALGAARRGVIWMVMREVLTMGAAGLALGLAAAWEATTFLKSFLFGVKPNDPLTLAGAVLTLIACAAVAGYGPAARASRVDPMTALRHE